ncbi:hypothetical protein MNBD_GAMMA11-1500 [hydrothermal vent metagenome]|uniref:Uncharacterized protein n=1 Tax=hydrothermal vent metagenome TaxID=652676 RepID=A0A3B0X5I0_9ZZZZ
MNDIKNKLTISMGLTLLIIIPELAFSDNSWTEFVPPVSMSLNVAVKAHTDNSEDWQKYQWRSGSGFNMPERFRFMKVSSSAVDSQVYALTEPQRKSVNPWKINSWKTNSSGNNYYTFGPTKRPWGRVPDRFSKKGSFRNRSDRHLVADDKSYRTRARYQPFNEPKPVRPYMNNYLLSSSNTLLPLPGYLPVYSNPMLINASPFFTRRSAYPENYLWR